MLMFRTLLVVIRTPKNLEILSCTYSLIRFCFDIRSMPHVGPNVEFIIHAYVPREYPMHPLSQDEEMANPDPAKDRYTTFFSQAHI